jgi:O-antigen/teichoic acid export membrane protein
MHVFFKKSIIALSIKVLAATVAFCLSIYLGRTLGSEQLGIYYLAISIVTVPLTLIIFGLNITVLKVVAKSTVDRCWGTINKVVVSSLLFITIMSLIIAGILFILSKYIALSYFNEPKLITPLQFIVLSLIPVALFNLLAHALQGVKRIYVSMLLMGGGHNALIFLYIFIYPPKVATDISLAYLFSAGVTLLIGIVLWFGQRKTKLFTIIKVSEMSIFKGSTSIFLSQMLAQFFTQFPIIILGIYLSSSDVALYAVSLKIAMLISFVLMAVNRVVAPDFSILYSQGEVDKLRVLLKNSSRFMLIVSIPMVAIVTLFPKFILSLYGDSFVDAAACLVVLAFAQFVYVATGNVNVLLQMTGNENVVRNSSLLSALISILSAIIFIPMFGIVGAGLSTLVSLFIASGFSAYKANKLLGINTMRFW